MNTETQDDFHSEKHTKENIKAARSLALNISLLGGPDLTGLGDHELVDRMFQMVGSLSLAAKKTGATADNAKGAFALMGKATQDNFDCSVVGAIGVPNCDRSACGDFSQGECDHPDCEARY